MYDRGEVIVLLKKLNFTHRIAPIVVKNSNGVAGPDVPYHRVAVVAARADQPIVG